jgi:hypothetical protein
MSTIKENLTFYLSAVLYFVFNMRPVENDLQATLLATGWQILQTAPYVAGATFFIVALLQYMAEGHKVPWNRRLRLFFAIGIMAALVQAIYEYAGQGTGLQ